jgi:hypothetical protein
VFGQVARVYEVNDPSLSADQFWLFIPRYGENNARKLSRICGPGCCATGRTPQRALATLHTNEEIAADELLGRMIR